MYPSIDFINQQIFIFYFVFLCAMKKKEKKKASLEENIHCSQRGGVLFIFGTLIQFEERHYKSTQHINQPIIFFLLCANQSITMGDNKSVQTST